MKKALQVIGILVAVAGAAFAAYVLVKKYVDSKKVVIGNDAENYVSYMLNDEVIGVVGYTETKLLAYGFKEGKGLDELVLTYPSL